MRWKRFALPPKALPRWRLLILAAAATWVAGYAFRCGPLLV
nr:H364 [uncultured bacterium]